MIDDLVYKIIKFVGNYPKDKLMDKIAKIYPACSSTDAEKAIDDLFMAREKHNVFSLNRPSARGGYQAPSLDSLKERYGTSKIGQLVLEIAQGCNLRCNYCAFSGKYRFSRTHSTKQMTLDIAKKAVDFYLQRHEKKNGICISFYGGEPLLGFPIIEGIIAHINHSDAASESHNIRLCTNGVLLNQYLEFFIENNIHLQVSLDGPSFYHDKHRVNKGGKGSFESIYNNLSEIYSRDQEYYRKNVSFICTIAPSANLLELNDFFLNDRLVKNNIVTVGYVDSHDTTFFSDCEYNDDQENEFKILRRTFLRNKRRRDPGKTFMDLLLNKDYLTIFKRPIYEKPEKLFSVQGPCDIGLRKLFIDSRGTFHMCEKINNSFPIGNVDIGYDLCAISNIYEKYFRLINQKDCLNCWANRFCSICFANCGKGGSFSLSDRDKYCKHTKKATYANMVTFIKLMTKYPHVIEEWQNTTVI